MPLKTLIKLFLRGTALWVFVKSFASLLLFSIALAAIRNNPDAPYNKSEMLYTNLAHAVLFIIIGLLLFKYSERLTVLFGKDFDFSEKIDFINAETLIAGSYAIIGVWLVAFSIPSLAGNLIKLQTGYYGLSSSAADKYSAIFKYSIVEDLVSIIVGVILIRFRRKLPPFSSRDADSFQNT